MPGPLPGGDQRYGCGKQALGFLLIGIGVVAVVAGVVLMLGVL